MFTEHLQSGRYCVRSYKQRQTSPPPQGTESNGGRPLSKEIIKQMAKILKTNHDHCG